MRSSNSPQVYKFDLGMHLYGLVRGGYLKNVFIVDPYTLIIIFPKHFLFDRLII